MQVGDIVKLIDRYALDSHKGHCGVVTAASPGSISVEVVFPLGLDIYRTSLLEVISASR